MQVMLDDDCDGVHLYDDGDNVSLDDGSDRSTLDRCSDCVPLDDYRNHLPLDDGVMECTLIFGDKDHSAYMADNLLMIRKSAKLNFISSKWTYLWAMGDQHGNMICY